MALVIVRLKLALLRGGLKSSGIRGIIGTLLAAVFSISIGSSAALLFALCRLLPPDRVIDAICAGFAVMFFVWVFGPIITATAEGTLDPSHLAVFPLGMRDLMTGLLASAITGFGGLASVIALGGALVATVTMSPVAVLALLAVVLQLLLCAAIGRLLSTAISGAARTRRWRDIAMVVGPGIALATSVVFQIWARTTFPDSGGDAATFRIDGRFDGALVVVRLLPSGLPGMAAGYARQGDVLPAVTALAGGIALLVAVLWLWHRTLARILTTAAASAGPARANTGRDLFPRPLAFLPRTRVGAVAAKELILTWRDPRQRMAILGPLIGGAVPLLIIRGMRGEPTSVLFASAVAYVLGTGAANSYGFDGRAHWTNVAAGDNAYSDLLGKNVARALLAAALTAPTILALAVRAGSFRFVLPAAALSVVSLGIVVGLGNVLSVRFAYPAPQSTTNVFSTGNTGNGLATIAPTLAMVLLSAAVVVPFALAFVAAATLTVRAGLTIAAMAIGAGIWYVCFRYAAGYSQQHQAELLAALQPRNA